MIQKKSLLCIIGVSLIISPMPVFDQDIAKLVSPKYDLEVDGQIHEIYYGYHGSLEMDIEKLKTEILPEVSSMSINQENKSLEIVLENVGEKQFFWVMIPFDVISAKGDDFVLLIDGIKTGYEFTKSPNDNTIGMVVPKGSKQIEIIGTNVIPEFGTMMLMVLSVSLIPIVFFKKFKSLL